MREKSSGINTPFENLESKLREKSIALDSFPVERIFLEKKAVPENEALLFEAAMADVIPMEKHNMAEFDFERPASEYRDQPDDAGETVIELKDLVEFGKGFVVENTPEYIEGAGPDVCGEVARRLHRGEFSIQSYVDLHGMNVHKAQEEFESFLRDSVASGKRGVLIVHGRGLSSPDEPVLKAKVYKWLTRGPWRKWIIAFSSARACDGGAGATYVLLRRSPATKKHRKKPRG